MYTIREITDLVGNPEAHPAVILISPAISVSIYLADFFLLEPMVYKIYDPCILYVSPVVLAVGLKHGLLI